MRRVHLWLLCALLLTTLPATAAAQAIITGVVRDTSGAVLPGVTVEAASPALIEKVRTAITDGGGQFRIIDLRPGDYTVTFALQGFSTVRREAIQLAGTATVTVNVELRVGALAETITVTGETSLVDVQSTTQQRAITREVLDNVPSGRTVHNLAALIPGMNISGAGAANAQDVGGSSIGSLQQAAIHGGRTGDQRVMMDGLPLNTAQGNLSGFISNIASTQEFTIDTSGVSAEDNSGGVRMNIVPREGGNRFSATMFVTGANSDLQSTNFDEELLARGYVKPNPPKSLDKTWDFNPAGGGPIFRDKLWFYSAFNYHYDKQPTALAPNANAGNGGSFLYTPDPNGEVYNEVDLRGVNTRLTWQINQKNKLAFFIDDQYRCICPWGDPATSPEARPDSRYPDQTFTSLTWTAPLTNRLLLDAAVLHRIERWGFYEPPGVNASLATVIDSGLGLTYRGVPEMSRNDNSNNNYRATMSYVTGAHALKVGFQDMRAANKPFVTTNEQHMTMQFVNGVPTGLTLYANPRSSDNRLTDSGIFVQDRWTVARLTLTGGLRWDYLHSWFPEQSLGPAPNTPNRNISIEKTGWTTWNDITPRMGAAYDLFGTGKTSIKVTLNKYLGAQSASGTFGSGGNPLNRLASSTTRAWTDANANFVPDCVQTNPAANGECGAYANQAFGQVLPASNFDPELLEGWGVRSFNWEFATSVQQELVPRVSLEVGYFRRWYGNFTATDNLAVTAADFDRFSVTAPADPRLPGGGNYVIENLYNVKPASFGRTNNLLTLADNYGEQKERWHGVDVIVAARPRRWPSVQGGISTGNTVTDSCEIREALPETTPTNPYCHVETKFLTQFKGLMTYTVPRIDVQLSAAWQSIPGYQVAANWNAPNSAIIPSLGRPLSGNQTTAQVNLIEPGTEYGDRSNQVDLRFGKIFRFAGARTSVNADLFNAFNANPVTSENAAYGPAWQRPLLLLPGRLIKFSATFDF